MSVGKFRPNIKPFHYMPGPTSFPLIGSLWNYLPIIGSYRFDRLHRNGFLKLNQYGMVVRENIVPKVSVVWLFDPNDIMMLFRYEGTCPYRRSHLALEKYRLDNPDIYSSGGLLPTFVFHIYKTDRNGPEWRRIRKEFQKGLISPKNVRSYMKRSDEIIKEFINTRILLKEHDDFLPELCRLYLELIGLVAFDESLGSFKSEELLPNSRTSMLIESVATINSCILRTDNGSQLWKKFDTPIYKKLKKAHQFLDKVAIDYVQKKMKMLERKENDFTTTASLLEQYLQNPSLTVKDVTGMAADMLLAGIDTMSYTSSFALYHLATNPDKQQRMREEIFKILPSIDDPVTKNQLSSCSYTKAVIKETFRMNPISVGVGRILTKEAVFSDYNVPPETVIVTQNQVTCRLSQYFQNPDLFIPERWISGEDAFRKSHPYLVLPYGHGPRMCIARHLANQNLQLFLINVIRRFQIVWNGDDTLNCISLLINKPDKPIKILFIPNK